MAPFLLSHCKRVALPPPPLHPASCQQSSSSPSAAAHLLIVLFFVVSAVVAPLPLTVHRVSSVAVVLQTVTPPTQPPRPASCQPSSLSAFVTAHLLIVVFVIVLSAVVAPPPPTVHRISSATLILTSSYRHPHSADVHAAH